MTDDTPFTARRVAALALALAAGTLLAAAAVAWPPSWGSPTHERPQDTAQMAQQAAQMGYDVHASLLGADTAPTPDPQRTLYVIPADRDSDGGPNPGRVLDLAEDGARVLLLDEGTGAHLLADHGWRLQATPVYGADLASDDTGTVPLVWIVDDATHSVEGHRPLPLSPTTPDTDPSGTPITTSNRTFADLDGDQALTDDDVRGPFTVGVDLRLDDGGRLVYLTTPHPVTDAAGQPGAEAFREALLVHLLPEGGTVVFDTSHADRPAGLDVTHQAARAGAWTATCTPCTAAGVALVAGAGLVTVRSKGRDLHAWTRHAATLDDTLYPDDTPAASAEEVDA